MRARVHDPGWLSLRRAARTAIVMPPLFALCLVGFHNQQLATFAAFGTVAMLAFADFIGPLGARIRAYAVLTACGVVLIVGATLLSHTTWPAVAGMAAAGFLVTFSGVLGGYVAAGGLAAILSFVLAVAVPAGPADLPARLAGWCLAAVFSAIAAAVLWPAHPRVALRRSAADASLRLADLIDALDGPEQNLARLPELSAGAAHAVTLLESNHANMHYRPAGPATHDESFAYLVDELRWSQQFADELAADRLSSGLPPPEDQKLAAVTAETLRDAAAELAGSDHLIDLGTLERARRENYVALEASLRRMLRQNDGPDAVARRLQRAYCTRILSFAVLSAAVNAALTAGKAVAASDFDVPPLAPAGEPALRHLSAIVQSHLRIESVWCRSGIRAAVALAAAILIAKVGRLEHGFWVVLATTSVLKSSGTSTRHTAWQSLIGTLAGFGIASALLLTSGGTTEILWAALPICVFLAVYTPTAVHFMIGQAMFTLMIVVLFNLIQPEGWRTGLVRVEDILVGLGTAVIVGTIFWPRGAYGELRASLASLFDAGGAYFAAAVSRVLGRATEHEAAAASAQAVACGRRASDAFATFLTEPGQRRVPVTTWSELLVAGNQLRVAGDALRLLDRRRGPAFAPAGAVARLVKVAGDLELAIRRAGRSLVEPMAPPPPGGDSDRSRPDAVVGILADSLPSPTDPAEVALDRIITFAWTAEWIGHVSHAVDALAAPLAQVQAVAARRWWQ
jgi:uncharacterized membrane protein YccC